MLGDKMGTKISFQDVAVITQKLFNFDNHYKSLMGVYHYEIKEI